MYASASYVWTNVTSVVLCWTYYDLGMLLCWIEIPRDFGLPGLYGFKLENIISLVIVFTLVLL
jgi:hypothetical protein